MQSLKQRKFHPVYLIEGEEPFYFDAITSFFEEQILAPHERDFNLTIFYGKDTLCNDVVGACQRLPMFAERQVVILKDAAQMEDLENLLSYVTHPVPTTIFLIEHRFKKLDARSQLSKQIEKNGMVFRSVKVKDEELPKWIVEYCSGQGLSLQLSDAELLAANLGNDLGRVANEIGKLRLNLNDGQTELSTQLIQKHIGVSKEYSPFTYPEALTSQNLERCYKMLAYFSANPKSAPAPLLIAAFYTHFEKLYLQHYAQGKTQKEVAAQLGLSEKTLWRTKDYFHKPRYSLAQIEECFRILAEWGGKAMGIEAKLSEVEWLRELTLRLSYVLH